MIIIENPHSFKLLFNGLKVQVKFHVYVC